MSETIRFRHGNIHGEMKPASPNDNPGELMIVGMPTVNNVDFSDKSGKQVSCPLCGQECWATPLHLHGLAMYPERAILACTQCALHANINKGYVPAWMKKHDYSIHDLNKPIITLFESV